MNESFIEFNNITKKFPRVIANNKVSFNINKSSGDVWLQGKEMAAGTFG